MEVVSFNVMVNSVDPQQLTAFYRDVVGLTPHPEIDEGAFVVGGAEFLIGDHSELRGPTMEPARVLVNFFVADLAAEQARLEALGVTFIRTAGREFWGGVISTFLDPDGNFVQLIESPRSRAGR